MKFQQWLESKGILIPDDIDSVIDGLVPKIVEKLPESLANIGKDIMVSSDIPLGSPYGIKNNIDVYLRSDPKKASAGSYYPGRGGRGKVVVNGLRVPSQNTERHIRRLLWHELGIHARDPKILDPQISDRFLYKNDSPLKGHFDQDYYQNPREVDAYLGEIIHSINKFGRQYKDRPEWAMSILDDTLAYLRNPNLAKQNNRYGLLGDSEWKKNFEKYVGNPKLKRLMLDRLSNAVFRAKEQIMPSAGNPASDRAKSFIGNLRSRK